MKFDTIFLVEIGETIIVSDNAPMPAQESSKAFKAWKSKNFTGILKEKGGISPNRWVKIEFENAPEVFVAYTIEENSTLIFNAENLVGDSLEAYKQECISSVRHCAEHSCQELNIQLVLAVNSEIQKVVNINSLNPQQFPILSAFINDSNLSPQEVVDSLTLENETAMSQIAQVELKRRNTLSSLSAATTKESIDTIMSQLQE